MGLYVSNIDEFLKVANENIIREFNFVEINEYLQQEDPENDRNETTLVTEESAKEAKAKKSMTNVSYGDMLKPCISKEGEFMGLQVRPELA